MGESGRHAAFIWAAYGLTGLVALGLVVRAVLGERRQARALARLEGAGLAAGRGAVPRG